MRLHDWCVWIKGAFPAHVYWLISKLLYVVGPAPTGMEPLNAQFALPLKIQCSYIGLVYCEYYKFAKPCDGNSSNVAGFS